MLCVCVCESLIYCLSNTQFCLSPTRATKFRSWATPFKHFAAFTENKRLNAHDTFNVFITRAWFKSQSCLLKCVFINNTLLISVYFILVSQGWDNYVYNWCNNFKQKSFFHVQTCFIFLHQTAGFSYSANGRKT